MVIRLFQLTPNIWRVEDNVDLRFSKYTLISDSFQTSVLRSKESLRSGLAASRDKLDGTQEFIIDVLFVVFYILDEFLIRLSTFIVILNMIF